MLNYNELKWPSKRLASLSATVSNTGLQPIGPPRCDNRSKTFLVELR